MTESSVSGARHVRFDRDDWVAIAGMAGFIVLLHVLGWGVLAGLIAPKNYQLGSAGVFGVGLGLTAYLLGIAGGARLGSRVASFVGLFEVLFAVLAAWALLGDLPAPIQLVVGVVILAGVVLVRLQREVPEAQRASTHLARQCSRLSLGRRAADVPETSRTGS